MSERAKAFWQAPHVRISWAGASPSVESESKKQTKQSVTTQLVDTTMTDINILISPTKQ